VSQTPNSKTGRLEETITPGMIYRGAQGRTSATSITQAQWRRRRLHQAAAGGNFGDGSRLITG
jgi:hypothetical protein